MNYSQYDKIASKYDTLFRDELKADIRKKLEENAKNAADNAFENAVVVKLIDKVQDPIPHCMFEHRADSLMNQFANQLKAQGVPMDMYLQYTGMDQDSLKATYLDRAENEVKLRLALEKIAELGKSGRRAHQCFYFRRSFGAQHAFGIPRFEISPESRNTTYHRRLRER